VEKRKPYHWTAPVRKPSNAPLSSDSSLQPSRNGYPQSFACKPKDWDCANFGALNDPEVELIEGGYKRATATINWPRKYSAGPSDEHLHAIGQFITIYSNIEWQIAELFAHFLGQPLDSAQALCAEANISMAGMIRHVQSKATSTPDIDSQTQKDFLSALQAFDSLSKTRHRVVHWQWEAGNSVNAQLMDAIRPRNAKSSEITLSTEELRDHCDRAVNIFRAIALNSTVIRGWYTRQQILEMHESTSPEKLFQV
jgi:hypothetical protein